MNPFDPPDSSAPPIRPSVAADTKWIIDFLRERWGASTIVVHGEVIDAARLQALIAEPLRGLATYRRIGGDAELVTLDATPPGRGTGTALIETLTRRLRGEGCARLWLTMTNGNLSALQFYLRRGFRLIAVRPGAVDRARELKPSIPLLGEHGIPIHDELDLCCVLDPDMRGLPAPAPWGSRAAIRLSRQGSPMRKSCASRPDPQCGGGRGVCDGAVRTFPRARPFAGCRERLPFGPADQCGNAGSFLLITRQAGGTQRYPARCIHHVGIIPCGGGRDPEAAARLKDALAGAAFTGIRSLRRAPEEPDSSCWLAGDRWWLSSAPVPVSS